MPLNIQRIDTRQSEAQAAIAQLREKLSPAGNVVSEAGRQKTIAVFGTPMSPAAVVERICSDVRLSGLDAVLRYTNQLDGVQLSAVNLQVSSAELAAAHAAVSAEFLETVRHIRENILRFQTAIVHQDVQVEIPPVLRGSPDPAPNAPTCAGSGDPRTSSGGYLRQRYLPLQRVGICVPGGAAAYPSTVLMTAVPAQAAGVPEIAVVAPPTPFGANNQEVLATCHELGIREVYRIGGAQGIAALAYGLEGLSNGPLQRVDKIVGPGNLFVALAKKYVFGDVDIDAMAGPSEIIVIADETSRSDFVAADMIAQAEHAPGSSVLITWHEPTIQSVAAALEAQLNTTQRGVIARESLEAFGALIQVADRHEAAALANTLATEHLEIVCAEPEAMLEKIRCAGAVFIGPYSPVAIGDYVAGPSHVLPTGATARFASGLSANTFLRSSSVIHFTQEALAAVADDAIRMAEREGLAAHGASISLRRQPSAPPGV